MTPKVLAAGLCEPHAFDRQSVIGSWLADHTLCGLSIREDASPITGNYSRFLPHAIV
jgi:glutathionylspermidine synthase